ncbi:DUF2924 domain-containing protein [Aestuariicoccus sp. MJ-SS9]|uniref:DUF2924 domain-containing protein n=1 Tax=Aestuariicoccus sp. MJ-SS9 TaxID=3079855 RepID=UPI002913B45F|nr:DUF2924 domain-containing protein [Aestuariicoccus sp. MJ-SS9]MDU8912866.1 DUF2924 domain-containing protein [Aestuariicoccus sp. MJ-SS9]
MALSARDLKQLWEARRGSPPPATLTARVLRVALAWDVQAESQGGEVSAVRRQWQAVMQRRAEGAGAEEAVSGLAAPSTSVGTRLLKTWGGETHEVIVREDGVVWNGHTYTSLSAVARAMTGTPRNGPRFFGLREDTL